MAAVKNKETVFSGKEPVAKKYPIEKLKQNCRQLFGISESAFAGVVYGLTGEYTIEEMKFHIETWKKKGVN